VKHFVSYVKQLKSFIINIYSFRVLWHTNCFIYMYKNLIIKKIKFLYYKITSITK
jgi:hypothetical protein